MLNKEILLLLFLLFLLLFLLLLLLLSLLLLLYIVLTISILIGQEPPAYFENSRDFVDNHDYSITCYPIICVDYTVRTCAVRTAHL